VKRVKFLHLTIRDFKSFLGEHQLTLDPSIGLYFMRGRNRRNKRLGSNGAGKSSIWDAIVWCCTGETVGGLRNPDVMPWKGSIKGPRVALLVDVDGRRRTIARTTSPNSLRIDDKDVGPEAVVKLLGMNFEIMTNTIILGQGRPLFFDMKPAEKMKLLSDAKNLDRWDDRSKRASEQARSFELRYAELTGEITGLDATVKELREGIKAVKAQEAIWFKDFEKRMNEAARFTKKNKSKIEKLDKAVIDADLKYDGAMTEVKACERDIEKMHDELRVVQRKLDAQLVRRRQLNANLETWNKQYQSLRDAKVCPTCGQTVEHADLAKHKKEIVAQVKKAREQLRTVKTRALKAAEDMLKQRIEHQRKYLAQFHETADNAQRELKAAQSSLAEINAEIKAIKGQFDEGEECPHSRILRLARRRLISVRQDLDDAKDDHRILEKKTARARYWIKGFKDIKLHVIEELLQELELTTHGMLEEVGLVGWRIKFAIERETKKGTSRPGLHIMIASPESEGLVKWESWSGGEGQRLRVVGALALSHVLLNHAGVEPSIEVLDEPTQHLSDEGVYDLCEYLADRARTIRRRIFYCDQQSVDSTHFAGVITVRKGKGGSEIVTSSLP
jgi:DNA repair exonuclease SbcCD ATPase subunit